MKKQRKIVLAYSGGLDTSIILKWLQEKYNAKVIGFANDKGRIPGIDIALKNNENWNLGDAALFKEKYNAGDAALYNGKYRNAGTYQSSLL